MESYSQFGDDLLLWKQFGEKSNGFFVEAGANHPTLNSQTYLFERRGWSGILVEPLAPNCDLLRSERSRSRVFQCALGAPEQRGKANITVAAGNDGLSAFVLNRNDTAERVEIVEVRTLDDVLAEAGNPTLDFVSLDVEGAELQVLKGFDLGKHRPSVLVVEDHLQNLWLHWYLKGQGYRLVKRTGCNSWYVPKLAAFHLASVSERMKLTKEIWLDTPVRCVRFFLKRRFAARRRRRAAQGTSGPG